MQTLLHMQTHEEAEQAHGGLRLSRKEQWQNIQHVGWMEMQVQGFLAEHAKYCVEKKKKIWLFNAHIVI